MLPRARRHNRNGHARNQMRGLTFAAAEKCPCIGARPGPSSQVWLPCSCACRQNAAGQQGAAATARPLHSLEARGLSLLSISGDGSSRSIKKPLREAGIITDRTDPPAGSDAEHAATFRPDLAQTGKTAWWRAEAKVSRAAECRRYFTRTPCVTEKASANAAASVECCWSVGLLWRRGATGCWRWATSCRRGATRCGSGATRWRVVLVLGRALLLTTLGAALLVSSFAGLVLLPGTLAVVAPIITTISPGGLRIRGCCDHHASAYEKR